MTMLCTLPSKGPASDAAASYRAALPTVATERLRLHAPTMDDYPVWQEIFAEETDGHLGGPLSEEDIWYSFAAYAGGWLLHGHGALSVSLNTTKQTVGFVLLGVEWNDREPEMGWLFPKRHHGNGYGVEAATALRKNAASLYGEGNFVSYIHPENAASSRLAVRLGASRDHNAERELGDGTHVWRHGSKNGGLNA